MRRARENQPPETQTMTNSAMFSATEKVGGPEGLPVQSCESVQVLLADLGAAADGGRARRGKLWLILQVALGATALAGAEPESSARPGIVAVSPATVPAPHISFGEPEFDFGKIKANELVRHEFVFTNAGNGLLEISKVVPGCGCTTVTATNRPIAPGKTGVIPIEFNPRGLNGPISRPITVYPERSHTEQCRSANPGRGLDADRSDARRSLYSIMASELRQMTPRSCGF